MKGLRRKFVFYPFILIGIFSEVVLVMNNKTTRLVAEQASGEPPFHCVTLDAVNRILYVGSMSLEDICHIHLETIYGR